MDLKLAPTRGTELRKSGGETLKVVFTVKEGDVHTAMSQAMMIVGTFLGSVDHHGIAGIKGVIVYIPPDTEYMIINGSEAELDINFSEDPAAHRVIYNPYLYEQEIHANYDPEEFRAAHPVPEGYIDILPKWYSIKFTYPAENYIFIRPGLGLSFQSHRMREEHWEVLEGSPIIVAGSKVKYFVSPGTKIDILLMNLHTIINPSPTEWVLLKETYSGTFDEEDIVRVFNPNHYNSPQAHK